MNEAKTLLDAGNLEGAIEAALNAVKSKPTDVSARTFLFELSCFSGNWGRAEKQLDVIGQQDVNAMIGAQIYKQNFAAERDRASLFSEGLIPECLIQPPKYVESLLVASTHIRENKLDEARSVLDSAEADRPAFSCTVNGKDSVDFRDYNDVTMCVFEVIIKESYSWLPFEHVEKIKFFPSVSLRDTFWRQAEVDMINGTKGEMFFPSLYVNTHKNPSDEIRLGRVTDWRDAGSDILIGEGARLFQYEGGYLPISEIETIEFKHDTDEEA